MIENKSQPMDHGRHPQLPKDCVPTLIAVPDLETIDAELRLIAAVRWSIREQGGVPSSRHVDELL
jgi:hypothetical protein